MSYRRHSHPYRDWTIPIVYVAVAMVLGYVLPRVELHLGIVLSPLNSATAIGIYSSIASGMIALTGIVFSLTFLIVQFSAAAYSPRLVLWMARDPFLSHALGTFVATFMFALIALAWIDRDGRSGVPFLTFLAVVVLLLLSIGMFVGLVRRVGALQISNILQFISHKGRKVIAEMYAKPSGSRVDSEPYSFEKKSPDQRLIYSASPQAVQSIDIARLVTLAKDSGGTIRLLVSVGDSVSKSTPLLAVFNTLVPIDVQRLESVFTLGNERTFEQDPKYAIRLLVDIAIKALSPAINDPTTAVQALDSIEDLLVNLGERELNCGEFKDERGVVRVVMPYARWEDFLRLGLDETLFYGATSVQVMRRTAAVISKLESCLPPERHEAIRYWRTRLETTVTNAFQERESRLEALIEDRQGLGVASEQNRYQISDAVSN